MSKAEALTTFKVQKQEIVNDLQNVQLYTEIIQHIRKQYGHYALYTLYHADEKTIGEWTIRYEYDISNDWKSYAPNVFQSQITNEWKLSEINPKDKLVERSIIKGIENTRVKLIKTLKDKKKPDETYVDQYKTYVGDVGFEAFLKRLNGDPVSTVSGSYTILPGDITEKIDNALSIARSDLNEQFESEWEKYRIWFLFHQEELPAKYLPSKTIKIFQEIIETKNYVPWQIFKYIEQDIGPKGKFFTYTIPMEQLYPVIDLIKTDVNFNQDVWVQLISSDWSHEDDFNKWKSQAIKNPILLDWYATTTNDHGWSPTMEISRKIVMMIAKSYKDNQISDGVLYGYYEIEKMLRGGDVEYLEGNDFEFIYEPLEQWKRSQDIKTVRRKLKSLNPVSRVDKLKIEGKKLNHVSTGSNDTFKIFSFEHHGLQN